LSSTVSAQYEISDLGTLLNSNSSCPEYNFAFRINNESQVAGFGSSGVTCGVVDRAFVWLPEAEGGLNSGLHIIGQLGDLAWASKDKISPDEGLTVIGETKRWKHEPITGASFTSQALQSLIGAPGPSIGRDIETNGAITGSTLVPSQGRRAFLWTGSNYFNLGSPANSGGLNTTEGFAINSEMAVVGRATNSINDSIPTRSTPFIRVPSAMYGLPAGSVELLGHLPNSGSSADGAAWGVNSAGWVVGESGPTPNTMKAFLWRPGIGMQELQQFPNTVRSSGISINNNGLIVGAIAVSSGSGSESIAVLWDDDTVHKLIDLLPEGHTWTELTIANDINDDGDIVGYGMNSIDGDIQMRPFRLTAVTPKSALTDTDGDAIPDDWEINGIPQAEATEARYMLQGADPLRKDIFVECDAMVGRAPLPQAMEAVVAAFESAPLSNPDNSEGISIHINIDRTDIPIEPLVQAAPSGPDTVLGSKFKAIKQENFGTAEERAQGPGFLAAKAEVYRYCLWGDKSFQVGIPGGATVYGLAEQGGNDFSLTLGEFKDGMNNNEILPNGDAASQAAVFMHELGHTLGLNHGGVDAFNNKPNHRSVMNYAWMKPLPKLVSNFKIDYRRGAPFPELNEAALNEAVSINGAPQSQWVAPTDKAAIWVPIFSGVPGGDPGTAPKLVQENGAPDWNLDGDTNDQSVVWDVNWIRQYERCNSVNSQAQCQALGVCKWDGSNCVAPHCQQQVNKAGCDAYPLDCEWIGAKCLAGYQVPSSPKQKLKSYDEWASIKFVIKRNSTLWGQAFETLGCGNDGGISNETYSTLVNLPVPPNAGVLDADKSLPPPCSVACQQTNLKTVTLAFNNALYIESKKEPPVKIYRVCSKGSTNCQDGYVESKYIFELVDIDPLAPGILKGLKIASSDGSEAFRSRYRYEITPSVPAGAKSSELFNLRSNMGMGEDNPPVKPFKYVLDLR
jgi:hypothetical protein